MNDFKTIKQLADELGVSKQAIQKRINKLPTNQQPTKVGGKYLLSNEICEEISLSYSSDNHANQPTTNRDNLGDNYNIDFNLLIKDLNNDKENMRVELSEKNKQIEKLQKLLDQQQILTLQANKKIEELEMRSEEKETEQEEKNVEINRESEKKSSDSFWKKLFRKEK